MQKRPPNPLTQDADPVPSPDPQGAVPGQSTGVGAVAEPGADAGG